MISIYLIRHGESEMNLRLAEIVSGRSNHTPLTEKGYTQARMAGEWLLQHGITPTVTIASPAVRTRETLATCLKAMHLQLPVEIEDRIQEISHGEMEGQPRPHVWNDDRKAQLRESPLTYALPGGESIADVQQRKMGWLNDIAERYPHQTILVASHGYAIRSLVGHLLDWDHAKISYGSETPNCSLTHITYDGERFNVEYVGRDIVAEMTESDI